MDSQVYCQCNRGSPDVLEPTGIASANTAFETQIG